MVCLLLSIEVFDAVGLLSHSDNWQPGLHHHHSTDGIDKLDYTLSVSTTSIFKHIVADVLDTIHLTLITLFLCTNACLRLLCSISRDLRFSAFYTQKSISLCMSYEMSLNLLPISCFNSVYSVVYDDRVYNVPLRCQSEKLSLPYPTQFLHLWQW